MKRRVETDESSNGFGEWGGYMNAKITKLEEQFEVEVARNRIEKESDLFNGISIFVNGFTNPSADDLKRIMLLHGGTYHFYKRSNTSFTIATNLPDTKVRQLTSEKVIRPGWVIDCLKARKLLDYTPYLLYTNRNESQPKINLARQLENNTTESQTGSIFENLELLQQTLMGIPKTCLVLSEPNIPIIKSPKNFPEGNIQNKNAHAKDATDPNFLCDFFQNSRLHHISALGADFKQYINDLRERHRGGGFPARNLLCDLPRTEGYSVQDRFIMHIDMDCFFVSVGLLSHPHLRGQPVAVTHSKGSESSFIQKRPGANRSKEAELFKQRLGGNGNISKSEEKVAAVGDDGCSLAEIASCSYEARKMGIHNGMFAGSALKLCPNLKTIPYDFESYRKVAFLFYDNISQYTLDIEAVSCDEMYVDLSELLASTKVELMALISFLREEIQNKTNCPCSAGVGNSKLSARMATKEAKPNGQFYLSDISQYMKKVQITDLPGVGYSTSLKLRKLEQKTCEDLQKLSLDRLQYEFGKKMGETLYQFCRGIDPRPLVYDHIRKSVSVDVNYGIRFKENAQVEVFLHQLCEELHKRMTKIRQKGKFLTLKILVRAKDAPIETAKYLGTGLCDSVSKSIPLPMSTNETEHIFSAIQNLFRNMKLMPHELRGIGVQMSKLTSKGAQEPSGTVSIKDMFSKAAKSVPKHDLSSKVNFGTPLEPILSTADILHLNIEKNVPSIEKESANFEHIIDVEYIQALPEDLREEVRRDFQRLAKEEQKICTVAQQNSVGLEANLLNGQNFFALRKTDVCISGKEELKKDLLYQPTYRQIFRSWIEASAKPEPCDVDFLAENAIELVERREIHALYIGLKFIFRVIEQKGNCDWHKAYFRILNAVQIAMLESKYMAKIDCSEKFEMCHSCKF